MACSWPGGLSLTCTSLRALHLPHSPRQLHPPGRGRRVKSGRTAPRQLAVTRVTLGVGAKRTVCNAREPSVGIVAPTTTGTKATTAVSKAEAGADPAEPPAAAARCDYGASGPRVSTARFVLP